MESFIQRALLAVPIETLALVQMATETALDLLQPLKGWDLIPPSVIQHS
ncbi:MAG: hypothetical protein J07HR59_00099 [Halorubrum sp. J07HR59]|nr:MAG: hypothetical protein J07HR59_00099 [Halorubrum sp. J07HR59]